VRILDATVAKFGTVKPQVKLLLENGKKAEAAELEEAKKSKASQDAALGIVMNDFVCMFLVIGVTMYLYWLKDKMRDKNDESMITMDDYTVKVYGLPQDVTEDRVRAHFGRFGEFHEIVFGRDLKELIDLRRKMLRLSPDKTKERAKLLAKINTAYSKNLRVVSCFVVYAEEDDGKYSDDTALQRRGWEREWRSGREEGDDESG